jgi:hypothetical protein
MSRDQNFIQISSNYHSNMLLRKKKRDKTMIQDNLVHLSFRPEGLFRLVGPARRPVSSRGGPALCSGAQPKSNSSAAQPFRALFSWRPSVAAAHGARATAPRAQATTWAWAGNSLTRLGQKKPKWPLADLSRTI